VRIFTVERSFYALQARDVSVLSANAIRSSLNFISGLFVHFLYALAWEEKILWTQQHHLPNAGAAALSAALSMQSMEARRRDTEREIRRLIGSSAGPLSDEMERRIDRHLMRNSSFTVT